MNTLLRMWLAFVTNLLFLLAFASGTAAAAEDSLRDSDNDGMPDAWEKMHGCDANDPSDADLDYDLDGFSNLEEFKAGSDPGPDILGYKALGKKTPVWKWSNEDVLDVLDRFAQSPVARFSYVVECREALAPAPQNEDLRKALASAYDNGSKALKTHESLPPGFLAALRMRAEKGNADLSEVMTSTNAAVQRVAVNSLVRRTATPSEISSLMQNLGRMHQENKDMALSVLLRHETPDVKAFLEQVQDPTIANRVRAALQKWGKPEKPRDTEPPRSD